ncbi:hypothetical protein MAR_033441, partial [Mya arenaria]
MASAFLTTNIWTSTVTDFCITAIEQIADSWKVKSNALMTRAISERHTGGEYCHQTIASSKFRLEGKIECCVHHNARNLDCAGVLACFAHTLQLCITLHSTILSAEVRKRQGSLDLPDHKLVQDVNCWKLSQIILEWRLKPTAAAASFPIMSSLLDPRYMRLPFLTSQRRFASE